MIALLPAVALMSCFVLILVGIRLLRPAGAGMRFDLAEAEEPERESLIERLYTRVGEPLGGRLLAALPESQVHKIRHRIEAAGRPEGLTVLGYAARKVVWTLLLGVPGLLLLLIQGNVFSCVLLVLSGWLTIDIWLSRAARMRQDRIDRDMPDFLDILAVVVRAGLRFRAALARIANAIDGPLSEEMLTTLRQIDLGSSRRAAFEALRDRNDSSSLHTFVTAMLQGEELGSPLADTLLELAGDMRKSFHQAARQRAARAVPRVSLVIVTVVVPGALVLLFVGIAMSAADVFSEILPSF